MKEKDKKYINFFLAAVIALAFLHYKTDFLNVALWLKVLFISSAVTLIPGYFLYDIFYRNKYADIIEIISLSFVFGLIFLSGFSFFSYVAELSLDTLIYIYMFSCMILGAVYIFISLKRMNPGKVKHQKERKNFDGKDKKNLVIEKNNQLIRKRLKIFLFLILALSFYMSLHYGGWPSGDFVVHLPKIRKIIELNKITYTDCFIKGLNRSHRGHNLMHLLIAMISRMSHVEPVKTWALSIMIFAPMTLLVFFSSTRVVFRDEIFAYFATFIWFLWLGIFNIHFDIGRRGLLWVFGSALPCPSSFIDIIGPVVLIFVFKFIYSGEKKNIYILPLLGICLAFIHMLMFLYLLFIIGSFLIFSVFFKGGIKNLTKKLIFCLLFLLSIGLPYTFYMQSQLNKPVVNPAYKSISGEVNPGWNPVVFLKDKYPIIDPFIGIWPGFLEKVAFISIPFLIFYLKGSVWAIYLISIPVVVLFILLNPILLYFLQPLHPPMQAYYALAIVVPRHLLFSMFIYSGIKFIRKKYGKNIGYFSIVVLLVILGKYAISGIGYLKKLPYNTKKTFEMVDSNAGFVKRVNEVISPGAVVLMDENKMWFWPVFFPHFMITYPNRGTFPPNFDPTPRKEGLKDFFENPLSKSSFSFLDKYEVDYLVMDKKQLKNKNFEEYKDRFQEVFITPSLSIYEYIKK